MTREILLTGSVPREPAAEVFRLANKHLGSSLRRVPDGEQKGWGGSRGILGTEDPRLEPGPQAVMTTASTPFGDLPPLTLQKLRPGVPAEQFTYPATDVSDIKLRSYQEFREMKDAGALPADIRFQATLPGPATTGGRLYMPLAVGVRAVGAAIAADIARIVDAVPHDELTIQLDLAVEVESEELRRRPAAFDTPLFWRMFDGWGEWQLGDLVEEVARVAETVPPDVELGFHLCGMWHIDPRGGQDIRVHVDWANALAGRLERRIDYIHMPSIPGHGRADYEALEQLRLAHGTKLFLGLVHGSDGIDGTASRIEAASQFAQDFGVAHFCGLFPIFGVDPERLEELLQLHHDAAQL